MAISSYRKHLKRQTAYAIGWKVAGAGCAIGVGAVAHATVHTLSAPLPSTIGAALSIASGLAWIVSTVCRSSAKLAVGLDIVAAGLAILAAICVLP